MNLRIVCEGWNRFGLSTYNIEEVIHGFGVAMNCMIIGAYGIFDDGDDEQCNAVSSRSSVEG